MVDDGIFNGKAIRDLLEEHQVDGHRAEQKRTAEKGETKH